MNIGLRTFSLTVILVAVLSAAFTKYYWPNVDTKTQIVEKEVIRTDVVTVTKEVVRPDGTKELVTTVTDKSIKKSDTKTKEIKLAAKPDYLLTGGVLTDFKNKPEYTIGVSKRILGPVFVGATYQTNNTYGLNVTIEF